MVERALARRPQVIDLLAYGELQRKDERGVLDTGSEYALEQRDRYWANFQKVDLDDAELILAWVRWRSQSEPLEIEARFTSWGLLMWGLRALALSLGLLLGTGLLAYDGSRPVNILPWLLLTALLPFVTSILLLVASSLSLRVLLHGPAFLLLSTAERLGLTTKMMMDADSRRLVQKSVLIGFQSLTWIYAFGAALSLLVSVAVSDLVFSWSSTLDLSSDTVARVFAAIASPWSWCLPQAVPELPAVEASHYLRFHQNFEGASVRAEVDRAVSQRWWMFCFFSTLVYGVLPRLLITLTSFWHLKIELSRWFSGPQHLALLRRCRMGSQVFNKIDRPKGAGVDRPSQTDPAASPSELDSNEPERSNPGSTALERSTLKADQAVAAHQNVAWGEFAYIGEEVWRELSHGPWSRAGVELDIEVDRKLLGELAVKKENVELFVHFSEPPVEDVLLFIREMVLVGKKPKLSFVMENDGRWLRCSEPPEAWVEALGSDLCGDGGPDEA